LVGSAPGRPLGLGQLLVEGRRATAVVADDAAGHGQEAGAGGAALATAAHNVPDVARHGGAVLLLFSFVAVRAEWKGL
jgi:hypothetical protein